MFLFYKIKHRMVPAANKTVHESCMDFRDMMTTLLKIINYSKFLSA